MFEIGGTDRVYAEPVQGEEMTLQTEAFVQATNNHMLTILAEEPASELEEFVYIVSHDLRNSARALTEVPQWLRSDLEEQGVVLGADTREDFDLLERHADNTYTGYCRVNASAFDEGEDLSAYLLQKGWAVALPDAPFEYQTLEKIARTRGFGVWGMPVDNVVIDCPASMGVAMIPEDGLEPDELIQKADLALYRAKNAGRNRVEFSVS